MQEFSNLEDIRQTENYVSFMQKIGWQVKSLKDTSKVEEKRKTYIFIKKFPSFPWSIIKVLRAKRLIQLEKLKRYRPLLIKQQPFLFDKFLHLRGGVAPAAHLGGERGQPKEWKFDRLPLIPTKTIWIDLSKTREQLLKEMKAKTRYNIKKTQNSKVKSQNNNAKLKTEIISGDKINSHQLKEFYCLWSKNKPFNFLFKPSFKELKALVTSFGKKCFFVFVWKLEIGNWKIITGLLVLQSKNMSFYWHNCSSVLGRKLFAPTLCVWQGILESKKRGLKVFDFEGIWDERYPKLNRGWQGFSRFKQGFGGEEIYFR